MKLQVQKDRSISACMEEIANLRKANTSYEIALAMNGYTIIPIRYQKITNMSHLWKGDREKVEEVYQANAN